MDLNHSGSETRWIVYNNFYRYIAISTYWKKAIVWTLLVPSSVQPAAASWRLMQQPPNSDGGYM